MADVRVYLECTGPGSNGLSDRFLGTALHIATAGLVYSIYLVNTAYPISVQLPSLLWEVQPATARQVPQSRRPSLPLLLVLPITRLFGLYL